MVTQIRCIHSVLSSGVGTRPPLFNTACLLFPKLGIKLLIVHNTPINLRACKINIFLGDNPLQAHFNIMCTVVCRTAVILRVAVGGDSKCVMWFTRKLSPRNFSLIRITCYNMQRFKGVASGKQSFREHCVTKWLLEANPRSISASKNFALYSNFSE